MSPEQSNEASLFNTARKIESVEDREAYLKKACGEDFALRKRIEKRLSASTAESPFLEQPPQELEATIAPSASRENLAEPPPPPRLAPVSDENLGLDENEAVVVGSANHSVLKKLDQTIDVPRIALRDATEEADGPIVRPSSPEVPDRNSDSRYQLQGEIARGGMGAIIRARDTDLGRDLAIKVLLAEHKAKPEVIQRFIEEAQIGGQLQHPGIAPVYELGQFSDQRPFFSMKLVKGETLSALLADRDDPAVDRAKLLGIFEQICQTMAYAHSRGVIHRDLKPANIMVGAFGEVQVIDWGLAKVLAEGGVADEKKAHDVNQGKSIIQTLRSTGSDTPGTFGSQTQMGSVMGTPAYMPPEQALGEIDRLDERADVFGLGAILCEILTGQPPYVADDATKVFRLASHGKLDDCLTRLDACGADTELIRLAKHCVAVEPSDRPKDAGVLVEHISGYLESVETKLRETEMERAAQAARAVEERKRRRVTLALAASVLLMIGLGGGGWAYMKQQQSDRRAVAAKRVNEALGEARLHQRLADAVDAETEGGLNSQIVELDKALVSAKQAVDLTQQEDAIDRELNQTADGLLSDLQTRMKSVRVQAARATADNAFQRELESIRLSQAGGETTGLENLRHVGSGGVASVQIAGPKLFDKNSALRLYEQAFRNFGLDIARMDVVEVSQSIRKSAIRESLIAALDDWARLLPTEDAKATATETKSDDVAPSTKKSLMRVRLLALADAADSSDWRKELRMALADKKIERLDTLAEADEVGEQSPTLIAWLAAALREAEKYERAVAVLRPAQQQQPDDYWLNQELGLSLAAIDGHEIEGLGYLRAALAIRPSSPQAVLALVAVHWQTKRYKDAELAYRRAIELDPKNAKAHNHLGVALRHQGKQDEAIVAYLAAIELDSKYADVHFNFGVALSDQGKRDEAIAEYLVAIDLDPKLAPVHLNLGVILFDQGRQDEAIAEFRTAINLDPKYAIAHYNLGVTLRRQGKQDEAIAEYRTAIKLDPKYVDAHNNLGRALVDQRKLDEAIAEFQTAIELDPKRADAHNNLGGALADQGKQDEAIAKFRAAIELDPKAARVHYNLGLTLSDQGKQDEAIAEFQTAIELNPKYVNAHDGLGIVLARQGKYAEASAAFRTTIELESKRVGAHNSLGMALHHQGKLDEASAAYRTAIELDPKRADAHYNLGEILRYQGKLDEASVEFRKCIELDGLDGKLGLKAYDPLIKLLRERGKLAELEELLARRALRDIERIQKGSVLITPHKAHWKWLHPTDGIDPAEAHKDFHTSFYKLDFDDTSWSKGQDSSRSDGGFAYGEESFNGTDIGTPADNDHRHTAYFRHRFHTTKDASHLELHCRRDDGIIVYLDGKEVIRDNVDEGPDAYRLHATNAAADAGETRLRRFPIDHTLSAGEHVIAISLHNRDGGSSDLRIGGITLVEVESKGGEDRPSR